MYVEDLNAGVLAYVDFDWGVKGHRNRLGTMKQHPRRKALYDDAAGKQLNEI